MKISEYVNISAQIRHKSKNSYPQTKGKFQKNKIRETTKFEILAVINK